MCKCWLGAICSWSACTAGGPMLPGKNPMLGKPVPAAEADVSLQCEDQDHPDPYVAKRAVPPARTAASLPYGDQVRTQTPCGQERCPHLVRTQPNPHGTAFLPTWGLKTAPCCLPSLDWHRGEPGVPLGYCTGAEQGKGARSSLVLTAPIESKFSSKWVHE